MPSRMKPQKFIRKPFEDAVKSEQEKQKPEKADRKGGPVRAHCPRCGYRWVPLKRTKKLKVCPRCKGRLDWLPESKRMRRDEQA